MITITTVVIGWDILHGWENNFSNHLEYCTVYNINWHKIIIMYSIEIYKILTLSFTILFLFPWSLVEI